MTGPAHARDSTINFEPILSQATDFYKTRDERNTSVLFNSSPSITTRILRELLRWEHH